MILIIISVPQCLCPVCVTRDAVVMISNLSPSVPTRVSCSTLPATLAVQQSSTMVSR